MASARVVEDTLSKLKRATMARAARFVPGLATSASEAASTYATRLSQKDAADVRKHVVEPLQRIIESSRRLATGNATPDDTWESITAKLNEVERHPTMRARAAISDVAKLRRLDVPLGHNLEDTIGSYLSGETGLLKEQQTKLKAKTGLGRRKTRKTRKNKTRRRY